MLATSPLHPLQLDTAARPVGALAMLLDRSPAAVLAITGTSGKTTTARLLGAMCGEAGLPVTLGLADALAGAATQGPEHRVIVELTPSLAMRAPDGLAVVAVTGLATDEMAPGQSQAELTDAYRHAVAAAAHGVVLNADDSRALALAGVARAPVRRAAVRAQSADVFLRNGEVVALDPVTGGEQRVCSVADTALASPALTADLLVATAAALEAEVPVAAVRRAALGFDPGPERQEFVGSRGRVRWINDAAATRPGRAVAALGGWEGNLLVIAGGRDDGLPLGRWARTTGGRAFAVLLFGGAAPRMAAALTEHDALSVIVRCADLDDAILTAARLAEPGDTVLFSPACEPLNPNPPSPGERFRDLTMAPRSRRARAA
jgi:UDP-N-acetylmuramoylalanine--D-glutamate ligase